MINFDIINDIPTTNKTVFLLADLDVQIDEYGKIVDDRKIQVAMPTIKYLVKTGARVVIATHLGRPSDLFDAHLSTRPIAKYLDKRLHCDVNFCSTCIGERSKQEIFRTGYGDVIVLENLFSHREEIMCDVNFARRLADGINIYVNDAFGYSDKPYSSVLCLPLFVRATGGLVLSNYVKQLDTFLNNSDGFSTAIIGGKMINKLELLNNLIENVRYVIVGGLVANNFLKAFGYNIGQSQFEPKCVEIAEKFFNKAKKNGCLLVFPIDVAVVRNTLQEKIQIKKISEIENDDIIVDVGTESVKNICDILSLSKCVFCDGLTGISEISTCDAFFTISDKIARLTKEKHIFSVISGQDTLLALKNKSFLQDFSFVSSFPDATLQYMSGKVLPGLEVLKRLSKQMVV